MKIILGVIVALVVIAGVWYMASGRAENQAVPDQNAESESAAEAASPRSTPRPEAAAGDSPAYSVSDETRDILIDELSVVMGRKVWFVTQADDREADSFQLEIEDAFLESGWEIAGSSESTISLRPGIRVFVADDELPDHVSVAVNGLRAAGFDVFAGSGYRAFYEKQKEKDPSFSGVELAPEQDFVIVVGPKPSAP